jgi:iron complex transport system ATP-binding protein
MMSVITLSNVFAAPWGPLLLQDIDFSVDAGEILGIIGPNGAGKSSLLHLMAGGIAATRGEITLLGKPISSWPADDKARAMSMLPQQSTLNFPYRVDEVIQLGRSPHASGANTDRSILQELMELTDTLQMADRLYTQLSGGEKQRVQLARVLAQVWRKEDAPGRLLLLDEPSNGLDLAHQKLVLGLIRDLAATGCAVALVVHDFNLLADIADRIIVLDQGKQVQLGDSEKVFTPATFDNVFGVKVHIGQHPVSGKPLVVQL